MKGQVGNFKKLGHKSQWATWPSWGAPHFFPHFSLDPSRALSPSFIGLTPINHLWRALVCTRQSTSIGESRNPGTQVSEPPFADVGELCRTQNRRPRWPPLPFQPLSFVIQTCGWFNGAPQPKASLIHPLIGGILPEKWSEKQVWDLRL